MTELIFIRHGETDWNREHRFQGQIDVPLNPTGREQAARLAQALAAEHFDRLYSSDLQRARQTVAPLERAQSARATSSAAWREQAFGVLEGLSVAEIQADYPQLWAGWVQHDADYCLPAGESVRHFHARVLRALRALVGAHARARLLVVTHGGVLDMLWRTVHGQPLHGPRTCTIPNTGINRLHWRAGTLAIDRWGDDAHLAGLREQPAANPPPGG